jgi:hypothetical protein
MNSITPMPTIVRAAQVLVDYESDELDLSDRTMCAFAIMLRAVPVMTVDCCTLLCIVHCLGRTFARIVMGIGPPVRFRSVWCRPERVCLCNRAAHAVCVSVAQGAPPVRFATQRMLRTHSQLPRPVEADGRADRRPGRTLRGEWVR